MSTRWYPLYQKGNPQLRVFLPNFWMRLVRWDLHDTMPFPPNVIKFEVSAEMSAQDVRNYLEKVYNIPVVSIRTGIMAGKTRKEPTKGYVIKDDDQKFAFVTLPKDVKFEFPDVCSKEKVDQLMADETKNSENVNKEYAKKVDRGKYRPDVPYWFS